MKNKSNLDVEYLKIVKDNPDKKFIVYLRNHLGKTDEDILKNELINIYGKCKELPEERLIIFVVIGNKVIEFINKLNASDTEMYLSFIQSEDELIKSK